jgi:predicted permease
LDIFLKTTLPLFLLIALGFLAGKANLMKQGDERTLSAFETLQILGLGSPESSVVVLMSAMPMAISMVVLSERYRFHQEMIASVILISSVLAGFYLNGWLAVLGK